MRSEEDRRVGATGAGWRIEHESAGATWRDVENGEDGTILHRR